MKFTDILKTAGSLALNVAFPGSGAAINAGIAAVNAILPKDKRLPETATGHQVQAAVDSLPPEQRASLLEKELDVEVEEIRSWTTIVEALAKADVSGNSTRPWIAKFVSIILMLCVFMFMCCWAKAILTGDAATLREINNSYMTILAILGPFVAWVDRYFGKRTTEKIKRYGMAGGQAPASPLLGLIQAFKKN